MIIDTSATIAVILFEPEAPRLSQAIVEFLAEGRRPLMSAGTAVECGVVVTRREADLGRTALERFLQETNTEIVPVDADQVRLAWAAFEAYGKGRHLAALNFGDCFAYALARQRGLPLLFKGADFSRTDVAVAAY